jgi:hypothetical protein
LRFIHKIIFVNNQRDYHEQPYHDSQSSQQQQQQQQLLHRRSRRESDSDSDYAMSHIDDNSLFRMYSSYNFQQRILRYYSS